MTTITGNARFREAVAARLVLAMRPDQSIADTAVPDAQSSPVPGDYSIQVDTHQVLLQAHAFDPAKLIGPWRSESVYAVGDVIFETSIDADALVLECTAVTGTEETGAAEPTWDTTTGNTTTDNDVTWKALGTISELSPITQFLYQAVLLSAVNPATGLAEGGTNVSLSGSGLSAFNAANGDTITVDGNAATNIALVSDSEITFDTPASDGGATGSVDVVVTIGAVSVTLAGEFEYTAPGSWAPSEITTALWLDSDDSATLTMDGSNNVEQWNDKSGNGRHFTQTTSSDRPAFEASSLNGKPGVFFDTGEFLERAAWASGNDHDLFAVVTPVGSGDRRYLMIGGADAGTGVTAPLLLFAMRNNNEDVGLYDGSSWRGSAAATTGGQALGWMLDSSAGLGKTYRGSEEIETITYSGNSLQQGLQLGARKGAANNWSLSRVHELVKLDGLASQSDRDKIWGYLHHKWRIEDQLPSGHPYKVSPP